jgi:hypothetical protein
VIPNFEEEIARAGYLSLILGIIEGVEATQSLENFIARNSFTKDAHGVAQFLNRTQRGKGLKVPVARAVANEAEIVGHIPDCFDRAIRQAVVLSTGG